MRVRDKRRLAPIEVGYYCLLAGLKVADVVDGWYDPESGSVELVRNDFITRVIIDASHRVPPEEKSA